MKKEFDFHDHELDHLFYFLIRGGFREDFAEIKRDFSAVSLVCKKWRCNLIKMLENAKNVNFDRVFYHLLGTRYFQYHGAQPARLLESYVTMWRFSRSPVIECVENLLPVDTCPHCKRLRLVIENRWCGANEGWCIRWSVEGCRRWCCNERVDPKGDNCFCCALYENVQEADEIRLLHEILDKKVEKAAYFIWKRTGRDDAVANYFEARQQIIYPPEIYPYEQV